MRRLSHTEEELLAFIYENRDNRNIVDLKKILQNNNKKAQFDQNTIDSIAEDTTLIEIRNEKIYLTDKGIETAKIFRNKKHRANIYKKMTSEDYLLAVYYLSKSKKSEMVSMSELAEELGLTNSAISEYIRTMEEEGSLSVQPRKGVKLTEKGIIYAKRIDRKRKILEHFFHNVLKIDSDLAEIEAHVLEHNTSNILIDRLEKLNGELKEIGFILKI